MSPEDARLIAITERLGEIAQNWTPPTNERHQFVPSPGDLSGDCCDVCGNAEVFHVVQELLELVAARDQQIASLQQRWQLIETAPKMRTILLFAVTDVGEDGTVKNWKMATGSYHTGYDDERSKERGVSPWEWDGHRLRVYEAHPTHWMPLPNGPADV